MNCFPDVTDRICKNFSPIDEPEKLVWCRSNGVWYIPTPNNQIIISIGDIVGFCSTTYLDTNGRNSKMNFIYHKDKLQEINLLEGTLSANIGDNHMFALVSKQIIRNRIIEKILD